MDEYKSVSKYLERQREKFSIKKFLSKLCIKILICIVLFLIGMIILKIDKNNEKVIYNFLYDKNINFAKINDVYQKYLGDILPFQSIVKNNVTEVFEEELKYTKASMYKDGVSLEVGNDYLVPILKSGIVIFIGEKEDYGNTVIIQQVDGTTVWYSNVENISINLYDYVSSGEFLGQSKTNELYLLFEKDGKFLDYKDFI